MRIEKEDQAICCILVYFVAADLERYHNSLVYLVPLQTTVIMKTDDCHVCNTRKMEENSTPFMTNPAVSLPEPLLARPIGSSHPFDFGHSSELLTAETPLTLVVLHCNFPHTSNGGTDTNLHGQLNEYNWVVN